MWLPNSGQGECWVEGRISKREAQGQSKNFGHPTSIFDNGMSFDSMRSGNNGTLMKALPPACETDFLRLARFSISVVFLVHGLVVAAWVSRIPAIQATLHLSPGRLGTAVAHFHGRRPDRDAAHRLGDPSRGQPGNDDCRHGAVLPVAPAAGAGVIPRLARRRTLHIWRDSGRHGRRDECSGRGPRAPIRAPIMSWFPRAFQRRRNGRSGYRRRCSRDRNGSAPAFHLLRCRVRSNRRGRVRYADAGQTHENGAHFAFRFTRRLALLGLLGFCILVGEGAMADWFAIYLRNSLGTSAAVAAIGYAVFSGGMTVGRFLGDAAAAKLGRVRLVRHGALLATAGLSIALLTGGVAATMAGFSCCRPRLRRTHSDHLRRGRKDARRRPRRRDRERDHGRLSRIPRRSADHRIHRRVHQPADGAGDRCRPECHRRIACACRRADNRERTQMRRVLMFLLVSAALAAPVVRGVRIDRPKGSEAGRSS